MSNGTVQKRQPPVNNDAVSANVLALAERLFVEHWTPNSQFEVEHLATRCLEAADAFHQTAKNTER